MSLKEMMAENSKQSKDELLSSITNEVLLKQAKYNMHKFEKLIFFAINFYLLSVVLGIFLNIITDIITNLPSNFSYISLLNQVPVLVVILVLYYFLKVKKYDTDAAGFIKSSLLKVRTVIAAFGVYLLYIIIAISINWSDFIKVASTNSTIISLTILIMAIIAAYIVYVYLTIFKPVYSSFKQLQQIISNQ